MGTRTVAVEEELMLLLAGTADRRERAEARMRALAATASFDAIGDLLLRQRLALILGPRAQALDLTPASFDAMIASTRTEAEPRALIFETVTRQVLEQLEAHGIPALPLKGTALSTAAYGSPRARLSQDVDVLVRRDQVEPAVTALAALGYRRAVGDRSTIHVTLEHESWRPQVEVHWRVHWYGDRFAARMLAEARLGADGLRCAQPAATIVALLLFYARDGFTGLRFAVDIASYADAVGDRLRAADILAQLVDDPEIRTPVTAALRVVRRVTGLDLGLAAAPLRRRDGMAIRLVNWRLRGGTDQIRATVRLVDGLLAPSRHWTAFFVGRFTPYESRRANALFLAKAVPRWLLALATIRGGRAAHPLPWVP